MFGNNEKAIIGMIHVRALPGTPMHEMEMDEIINTAREEAEFYRDVGLDAIMIENMHDTPYLCGSVGPEIVAAMAAVGYEVKRVTQQIPCGVQILAAANREAIAVAKAAGLDFVRVEGFAFAHVADEGLIEGCAGELLRYRRAIAAQNVQVFADIKKKHSSHALTADVDVVEMARAVEFMHGDAIILTGPRTGVEPDLPEVQEVKQRVALPIILGSGITVDNIPIFYNFADGFIVGSEFKRDGYWANEIDHDRVYAFYHKVQKLRGS